MTRRTNIPFSILLMLGVLVCAVLPACSDDDPEAAASKSGTDSSETSTAPGSDEPDEIVVYGSAGLIEEIMNTEILPRFEEETGIRVNYQGLPSADALARALGQRSDPEASLILLNNTDATEGHLNDAWASIDLDLVPTIEDLPAEALGDDGTSVAVTVGAWLLAANMAALEGEGLEPPPSWLDLFEEPYSARTIFHTFSLGQGPSIAWILNQALGGDDSNFQPLLDLIDEKGDRPLSYVTQTEWDQLFTQQTAWIGTSPNTRVGIHATAGLPVEIWIPEEGAVIFEIRAAIPTNAEAPRAASRLLDFLLQPEQQVLQSEALFYSPVHPDAEIDPDSAQFSLEGREDQLIRADTEVLLEIKRDVIPRILEMLER